MLPGAEVASNSARANGGAPAGCTTTQNSMPAELLGLLCTAAAACTPPIAPLLTRANRSAAPFPIAALGAAAIAACPLLTTALLAFVQDV